MSPLKDRERLLERFFEMSRDMLAIAGVDGYFKVVSPAFERTLGWSVDAMLGTPFVDFVHPEDVEATAAEIAKLSGGQPTISFHNRFRCRDGSYRTLDWTAAPDPETGMLYAVARDVTDLEAAHERFRVALEASPGAMLIADGEGAITFANAQAELLLGYGRDELVGAPVEMLVPLRFREGHAGKRRNFHAAAAHRPMGTTMDLFARRKDGSELPVEIGLSPVNTRDGRLIIIGIFDLTERKALEGRLRASTHRLRSVNRELADLAATDSLTSLANRRAFEEFFDAAIAAPGARGEPMSVMMLDIDHFKQLNDTLGHQTGDAVLEKFGAALRRVTRRDDLVARYGGEEFIIVMPGCPARPSLSTAQRFLAALRKEDWGGPRVTASAGVATIESAEIGDRSVEEIRRLLVERADRALYQSKNGGRDRATHASLSEADA